MGTSVPFSLKTDCGVLFSLLLCSVVGLLYISIEVQVYIDDIHDMIILRLFQLNRNHHVLFGEWVCMRETSLEVLLRFTQRRCGLCVGLHTVSTVLFVSLTR